MIINHTTEGIELATNEALRRVNTWIEDSGLQLAHSKTEAVVLTAKWAYREPDLYSGGVRIPVKRDVRYLGVRLDSRLTFTKHVRAVSSSAVASARALARIMPNVGGPSATKRKLLASVITSKILYAAPVWAPRAVKFRVNKEALARAQRVAALRITRCYRTVSTAAATLLAVERETIRSRRKAEPATMATEIAADARAATLGEWQRRWEAETTVAAWTRRVLPSVRRWTGRPRGFQVTFHLAQALTGHGAFNGYLHRFGLTASAECALCGASDDDVEHTLFVCLAWEDLRTEVNAALGRRISPDDIEETLCGDGAEDPTVPSLRRGFLDMVEGIMLAKENEERKRQRRTRGA